MLVVRRDMPDPWTTMRYDGALTDLDAPPKCWHAAPAPSRGRSPRYDNEPAKVGHLRGYAVRVALQECRESNSHFVRSMAQPVDFTLYEKLLGAETYSALLRHHPTGSVRLWGLKPTETYVQAHDALRRGDLVLFHEPPRKGAPHTVSRVFRAGRVGLKLRNARLADLLWGDSGNDLAYELIFTVEHTRPVDSPLSNIAESLGLPRTALLSGFQIRDVPDAVLAGILPVAAPSPDAQPAQAQAKSAASATSSETLVFVALEAELRVLKRRWSLSEDVENTSWVGTLPDHSPVRVLCAFGAGRVRAAVTVLDYFRTTGKKPALVVVLGMCGGFAESDGVVPGDVIVADSIADLGTRKIREDPNRPSPEFRIVAWPVSEGIVAATRRDAFAMKRWEADVAEEFDYPAGRRPTLRVGTLVCADEVVSSDEWRASLLTAWPKAYGVEMEAGGVIAACARLSIPVTVVRGVSDLADPLKADDEWRNRSMRAASTVVERAIPLLLQGKA